MSPPQSLLRRIVDHEAKIGVVGVGYVGLPLSLTFAAKGFPVIAFDVDEKKISSLNEGLSYIEHIADDRVKAVVEGGRFGATDDFTRLGEPDVVIICVPTPLDEGRQPDMSYIEATAAQIALSLRPGQLVTLESTTYPGTTDELLRGILETSGLVAGTDFHLAYSPERENPGGDLETAEIPKIVGGFDTDSAELAEALYNQIVVRTVRVDDTRVAEATKLTENVFRAVNVALVNELKMIFDRMGIDVWQVLDAAESKPFGFMRFNPGPGWGGHCIPIDPFYLTWKAEQYGIKPEFIELAGRINVEMPGYVVEKLREALTLEGRDIPGAKILLLGLAYKKDVGDPRESPAFEIFRQLLDLGAQVGYHDPWVPETPTMRTWSLPKRVSLDLDPETLEEQDAVIVVTDHTDVDYELVARHARVIVDTRGVYRDGFPNVTKA